MEPLNARLARRKAERRVTRKATRAASRYGMERAVRAPKMETREPATRSRLAEWLGRASGER